MSVSVKFTEIKFDFPMKRSAQRRILRKVGAKVATRARKRFIASSGLRASGELGRSIKFKLRKGAGVSGFVTFRGTRKSADTHKHRAPRANFLVGVWQANAKRIDLDLMSPADEAFFREQMQQEIDAEFERMKGTR